MISMFLLLSVTTLYFAVIGLACQLGFYGLDCSQLCSLCKNESCGQSSCTYGCKDGYFQDNFQGNTGCRKCKEDCVECLRFYDCTKCPPSHYLHSYVVEGENRTECQGCFMVPRCETCLNADTCLSCQSVPYCQRCKPNGIDSFLCVMCEDGYKLQGEMCISASACSDTCSNDCKQDRTCNGCGNGFSGPYCNQSCSQWCETCSQTDTSYCFKCKSDRYTRKCEIPCSTKCLQTYGKITCDINNGSCLNGCKLNTWGDRCEHECSPNCQNGSDFSVNTCSSESGSCLFGCAAGYTGASCNTAIVTSRLSSDSKCDMPTSDTYCNTVGLLRSRVLVSDLLEYIMGKKNFGAEFEILPQGLTRTCKEALKPSNREKNRYNGIYAYDASRVVLQSKEYINACYIEGQNTSTSYIASLGPTKSAMPQFAVFWEMVWQENTRQIVMLTNLEESGKMKCDQYWPDEGSMRTYGHVSVTNKSEKIYAEFVVRELQIAKTSGLRLLTQYHYIAWPDKSVPDTVASFVEFRDIVERDEKTSVGPLVVHCSAGIGRTGTYIALDSLIKQGKRENSVDIFGCVMDLRGQRVNMVQNVEQYIYLHYCVVYALTCNPSIIDASELTQKMTDSTIEVQYQNISSLPALPEKEISAINTNKKKKENRKGADIPGDRHRVKMKMKKDYINAIYVDGYEHSNQFIAAQTPMPSTVDDFVAMIHQESLAQIVCLDEEDATDKTVAKYIPSVNKSAKFGQFQITVMRFETHDAFSFNELKLCRFGSAPSDERITMHYQVKGWAMGDELPTSATAFLQLVTTVKKSNVASVGPIVVHCLDGARKCGLFCAVANMLEKLSVDKQLSVINTICQVRARRRSALQNFDQFKFCYRCVKEYLETAESKTYYNIL